MTNFSGLVSVLGLCLLGLSACGAAAPRVGSVEASGDRLWVLAPHPDDELLVAGETLRQAVAAHRPITVLVMTNGDLGCERDGYLRESETIAALGVLGVPEEDVHFLGYPDGYLDLLGETPLEPLPRTAPDGSCGLGSSTYAVRGQGQTDLHTTLFGAPGRYVAGGPVGDLAALLERERPGQIVVTHPIDTHPDHAMTYVFLHRALERAQLAVAPTILRAVVHQGPCWPNGAASEPCPEIRLSFGTPMPAFAAPLEAYAPALRVRSDDDGLTKRLAIARYASQLGTPVPEESWLASFARADEVFWPVTLVADPHHPGQLVREPAGPVAVARAAITLADAGGSAFFELGGLRVTVDARGAQLSWNGTALRQVPWAHGEAATDPHTYELRLDVRTDEGPVIEATLRRDAAVLSIAVIPGAPGQAPGRDVVSGAERATVDAQGIVTE